MLLNINPLLPNTESEIISYIFDIQLFKHPFELI
jgi:hypothetical protein